MKDTKALKTNKRNIVILLVTMFLLVGALLVMTVGEQPVQVAQAYVQDNNAAYAIYVLNSEGTLISSTTRVYGGYDVAENFGRLYWFANGSASNYVYQSSGHASITNITAPLYEGDKIKIKFTNFPSPDAPNGGGFFITFNYSASEAKTNFCALVPSAGQYTDFTIPTGKTGDFTITARDNSNVHNVNTAAGGNYYYICNFNVISRNTTVSGGITVNNYVTSNYAKSYSYTGSVISPFSNMQYVDYVSGTGSASAIGDYSVYLKPKMSYKWADGTYGAKLFSWSIQAADLSGATVEGVTAQTYTGSAVQPKPTVSMSGKKLTENTDYTLSYSNNMNASSSASVTITGKGNYKGTYKKTFTINKASTSSMVVAPVSDQTYTGSAIAYKPIIIYNSKLLVENTDYVLSYSDNIAVGKATIKIDGMTNFSGSKSINFDIVQANASSFSLSKVDDQTYTASEIKPSLVVKYNGTTLTEDTDYTLTYSNNINKGESTITVSGINSFKGTKTLYFDITAADASSMVIAAIDNQTYTGVALTPALSVSFADNTLVEDTDYTLFYSNNINAGTATVTLSGTGNFSGSVNKTFSIKAKALPSGALTLNQTSLTYTGKALCPTVTVKDGNKTLTLNTDYTLSTANNVVVGSASVTVTGKGNYSNSLTKNFAIVKATQTIAIANNSVAINSTTNITNKVSGFYAPLSTFTFTPKNTAVVQKAVVESNALKVYSLNAASSTPIVVDFYSNGGDNFKAVSGSFKITVICSKGFYVKQTLNGVACEVYYNTLNQAATAAGNGGAVYIKGDMTVAEKVTVSGSLNLKADSIGGTIIKSTTFHGEIFAVGNGATLNIDGLSFVGNYAKNSDSGCIISNKSGSLSVENSSFTDCGSTAVKGGAIVTDRGETSLSNSTFKSCRSTGGGAAYVSGEGAALTVTGCVFNDNVAAGSSARGGAIYAENGAVLTVDGGSFSGNIASGASKGCGGAIAVDESCTVTVQNGSSFAGNAADKGGAIYIESSASGNAGEININGCSMSNNQASVLGNGIVTDGVNFNVSGTASTSQLSDSIAIIGKAQITVTGGLEHNLYVEFSDPEEQLTKTKIEDDEVVLDDTADSIYIKSDTGLSGPQLKQYLRVVNSGYTFNGTVKDGTGNSIAGLILQHSAEEVAYVQTDEGWSAFSSLQQAIKAASNAANKTVYLVQYKNDVSGVNKKVTEINETLVIPENANISFRSVLKHTPDGQNIEYLPITDPAEATILIRGENLNREMIRVEEGASLNIGKGTFEGSATAGVILDGGALWKNGNLLVKDDGKGGAGSASTSNDTDNNGLVAHAPVIVNRGQLNINDGAIIRNNDNNYAKPGEGFGSQNYGGGVRNEGAGNLTMSGGEIYGCYSREGGAIMNVNKPKDSSGEENPTYVSGGNPTVTIKGGKIYDNASQMKGAAIQTIYGGATTIIEGGEIINNHSLHDLGTLSVEEGGSLKLSGGTISPTATDENGVVNSNAVYIYNKYSQKDYEGASTKPYIEGADSDVGKTDDNVARIALTGSPVINGNIHIDKPCVVVNSVTNTDPDGILYAPVLDANGYSPTDGGIKITTDADRTFGDVAINVSDSAKNKIEVTTALDSPSTEGYRFNPQFTYYTPNSSGGNDLKYSGFNLGVEQTSPSVIRIKAQLESDLASVSFDVGNKSYTLTDGDYVDIDLTETSFNINNLTALTASNENITSLANQSLNLSGTESTVYALLYEPQTARLTVPATETRYLSIDGDMKDLADGEVPFDLKLDDNGNGIFEVTGEEREIYIGVRNPAPQSEDVAGTLIDFTDDSFTLEAVEGLEYNLIPVGGDELVYTDSWIKPQDGTALFAGLDANTEYTVIARTPISIEGDTINLPSLYVPVIHSGGNTGEFGYITLSNDEALKKAAFENAYNNIKENLPGGSEAVATSANIWTVIDLYGELAEGIGLRELASIEKMIGELVVAYDITTANEWKVAHDYILSKDVMAVELTDKAYADSALDGYANLGQNAKTLVIEEFTALCTNKKQTAKLEIESFKTKSLNGGADAVEIEIIASEYAGHVDNVNGDNTKDYVDLFVLRASAAIEVRGEYDEVLLLSETDMTQDSLTALSEILYEGLISISASAFGDVEDEKDSIIRELQRARSKGIIQKYYDDICVTYEENGITSTQSKQLVEGVKDNELNDLDNLDLTLEEIIAASAKAQLALDKAEAKAVLYDYLSSEDAEDIKDLVYASENGAAAKIDGANTDIIIDGIVASTKLVIERERAKDRVEEAAEANPSTAAAGLVAEFTVGPENLIDKQADTDNIWLQRDRAIALIELENARQDYIESITTTDPRKSEKESLVNEIINAAASNVRKETNGATALSTAETESTNAKTALDGYDRKHFTSNHTILNKELEKIGQADLTEINAAIIDLEQDYITIAQDAMDDLRDSLLNMKKAALADLLVSECDGTGIDAIVENFVKFINQTVISGDTTQDNSASRELDELQRKAELAIDFEQYKNQTTNSLDSERLSADSDEVKAIFDKSIKDILEVAYDQSLESGPQKAIIDEMALKARQDVLLQRQKDEAKAKYDQAYQLITGERADDAIQAIIGAHIEIDSAQNLDEVNEKLGENVTATLESLLLNGDSNQSKQIVADAAQMVDEAISSAPQGTVAVLPDGLDDVKTDIFNLRENEKQAAQGALEDYLHGIFGDVLPDGAAEILADANKKIENGEYDDYPLITEQAKAKATIYEYYAELAEEVQENGFTGINDLNSSLEKSYASVDNAHDFDEVALSGEASELELTKTFATIELKNYLTDSDSDKVSIIVNGDGGALDEIKEAESYEQIRLIVEQTKTEMDARRYLDENACMEKSFSEVDASDKESLVRAIDSYGTLPENVKDFLDEQAHSDGYTDFGQFAEDRRYKSDYEQERDDVIAKLNKLVRQHDGQPVRDTLASRLKVIDDIDYLPCTDVNREQYYSELTARLEDAKNDSDAAIGVSQKKQRTENQIQIDAQSRIDGGAYTASGIEAIEQILSDAKKEIQEIEDANAQSEGRLNEEIDRILEQTLDSLDEIPVIAVIVGNIKPDKTPASDSNGDYDDNTKDEIWGIVTNDASMPGGIKLVIKKTEEKKEDEIKRAANAGALVVAQGNQIEGDPASLIADKEIKGALDIYLVKKDGVKITEFEGKYIIKILMTDELRSAKGLQVVYVGANGEVEVFATSVEDGKYLVFTTEHFSEFYILAEPVFNLWWLIILLVITLVIEAAFILRLTMKKKKRAVKMYSFLPLSLAAVIVPEPGVAVCIVLGIIAVAAAAVIVLLLLRRKKANEKGVEEESEPNSNLESAIQQESKPALKIAENISGNSFYTPVVHTEKEKQHITEKSSRKEANVMAGANVQISARRATPAHVRATGANKSATVYANTIRFVEVAYDKSFKAKLIQSDELLKDYYSILKNELESYGVKSRLSWKRESFRKGRVLLAVLRVRGKSLCIYLPLSPAEYAHTKFKVEDVSNAALNKDTPCLYRIKNTRRCQYAKSLIAEVMSAHGLRRVKRDYVDYTAGIPYESIDVLLEKKLVKALPPSPPKSTGIKQTATSYMRRVNAAQVKSLMLDEAAATFITTGSGVANRKKTVVVNIDTLSQCFVAGDRVTLEEIKKRVSSVGKNVTYVKVLARGWLDKPLIVEADDFSLDAVKMITLTGGRAIRTSGR